MDGVSIKALDQASLVIKSGEFVSIMGPSGSGKSTLMYLLGCLDTPSSGKIYLEGKLISGLSEEELAQIRNRKIGFVFQSFNLLPRTSALNNVALPLLYTGKKEAERKRLARQALESVGLKERVNHFSSQLSGGEQQRVAIARALVTDPLIIFADEPTGNLDTKSGKEIMAILEKLNQEGRTIITVTHDPYVAGYAKRIIKIIDGKINGN